MKILVVDDEKLLVKGIKFNLENDGYEVSAAYDGEEAVELAKTGNYDLIILDDYLTKPFNILELKARIRALLRRSAPAEPKEQSNRISCGDITLDSDERNAYKNGVPVELTAREFDLMELLMRNPGHVYSRENLLNLIWGYEYQGEIRSVDVHVRRLREKLERVPAQPEYIMTKWGVGYYFKG